jgi:hypothetical protein
MLLSTMLRSMGGVECDHPQLSDDAATCILLLHFSSSPIQNFIKRDGDGQTDRQTHTAHEVVTPEKQVFC